jgi:hypothetical protein
MDLDSLFHLVQTSLRKKDLIPLREDTFHEIQQLHGIQGTYNELKDMMEKEGLDVQYIYASTKGLFPFWYIDGFAHVPLPSLTQAVLQMGRIKETVEQEKKELQRLWNNKKWMDFFMQVHSQFSFDVFLSNMHHIPQEQRYPIFRKLYVQHDYGFQEIDKEVIRQLFLSNQDHSFKKELGTDENGFVTIYRGMQDKSAKPMESYSWTLDFEVAKKFATRFNSLDCSIYQAKIHINHIVDYIPNRGEEEILLLPEHLVEVKDLGFYNVNEEMVEALEQENLLAFYHEFAFKKLKPEWFHNPDGVHGVKHIKRVLFLTVLMSYIDELSEADRKILAYASLYHDIGRTHDWEDEGHGMKSVLKMEKLKLPTKGLTEEEVNILKFIMKYHSIRDEVGLKKIQTEKGIQDKDRAIDLFLRFKDCDGIDRVRLGDLDIRYLRTETGKKLMLAGYQLLQNLE